jgi:hypothetical protein
MRAKLWLLVSCRALVTTLLALVSALTELFRAHPRLVAAKLGLGGVLLSLTGLVAACDSSADETGEDPIIKESCYDTCYTPDYGWPIDSVTYGHDEDSWQYLVELMGWAEMATLDIRIDDGLWAWDELHEMQQGDYDPNGAWDTWQLDLAVVDDVSLAEAGVTTMYPANAETEALMTWRVVVFDGPTMEGCVVWGHDPASFDDIDCSLIEAD